MGQGLGIGNDAPPRLPGAERPLKGCRLATLAVLAAVAGCAGPPLPNAERPVAVEGERAPRPLQAIEPRLRAVIQEGALLWGQPPTAENTVACATCHFDNAEVRGWAASFPKVKPMPPPFTRVMTLQQAVAETVATHYRIPPGGENRRVAQAIAAFLTWVGEGLLVTPGVAAGQPRFPDRLAALGQSVVRGLGRIERACAGCHADGAEFAGIAATFPRVPREGGAVVTLEEYLERHTGLAWDGPEATDVAAFLASRAADRLVQPGRVWKAGGIQGGSIQ